MRVRLLRHVPLVLVVALLTAGPASSRQQNFDPLRGSLGRDEPQPIYRANPTDPWNRVFYLLFTRTVEARIPADFNAPFGGTDDRLILSDRVVPRIESGDRAIDPLYPSLLWMGSSFDESRRGPWETLKEPRYSLLESALADVVSTAAARPPLARALMQADLWAAFDMFQAVTSFRAYDQNPSDVQSLKDRRDRLLPLIAHAIRALALTRDRIAALPDTYAAAGKDGRLPDLFSGRSGWIEVRWGDRFHDHAVHYRRATRVFVKPSAPPADESAFVNDLRQFENHQKLSAVALVTETLLVASDGTVLTTPLVSDVQIRALRHGDRAAAQVREFELSRRLLLTNPASGGFQELDEQSPVYLPAAGNDYSFASPSLRAPDRREPVLAPLRQRCAVCHGLNGARLMTFNRIFASRDALPPVERLRPAENLHARDVAARKLTRDDFHALIHLWR